MKALGNKINVIIVATGFGEKSDLGYETTPATGEEGDAP
jgi:hypothetical protein